MQYTTLYSNCMAKKTTNYVLLHELQLRDFLSVLISIVIFIMFSFKVK